MKVKLLTIGKTKFPALIEMEVEYESRLKHYISYERIDLPDVKNAKSLSQDQLKKMEGTMILSHLKEGQDLILLDEKGQMFDSVAFADHLNQLQLVNTKYVVFCIGGAFGFSSEVYARSKSKISLSKMTFSHQLIRTVFLEQLYRAQTILKGEKYHHA